MGLDSGGPSLDDGRMAIHSDTLFSALCCELSNDTEIARLYDYFASGVLTVSDALPYRGDELYLPKPILFLDAKREGKEESKKALKALEYIPLSFFAEYLKSLSGERIDLKQFESSFGVLTIHERAAIKGVEQAQPYSVATWRFANDSGLYILLRSENDAARTFFEETLTALGLSGIGGKRSSGLGKFAVENAPLPPELLALLDDEHAPYQMLLGTALPADEELDEVLSGGWYLTVRRGGFVQSASYAKKSLKKRTIYMLGAGSCLKKRFDGDIFDLSSGGNHPVWRCGKTLFVGVAL
jgi:CRISPR-associated protein Csm4